MYVNDFLGAVKSPSRGTFTCYHFFRYSLKPAFPNCLLDAWKIILSWKIILWNRNAVLQRNEPQLFLCAIFHFSIEVQFEILHLFLQRFETNSFPNRQRSLQEIFQTLDSHSDKILKSFYHLKLAVLGTKPWNFGPTWIGIVFFIFLPFMIRKTAR